MSCNIRSRLKLGIVEIVYSGCITIYDIEESTAKALAVAIKTNFGRFLVEFRDADIKLSTADIFNMPGILENMQFDKKIRAAIIVPDSAEIMKKAIFYETVCNNRGWQAQVFTKRQDAINWLLSENPSKNSNR